MAAKKSNRLQSSNKVEAMPMPDLDWRARDDLRTLKRAEEINSDKKRLAAAQKCAKEEAACLQKIAKKAK